MKSQDSKDSVNIPYELYLLIGLSNNIPFEMIKDRYINELINRKMYSDDEIKIINDKIFFNWLKKNTKSILDKKKKELIYAIKKSCQIKMFFVKRDTTEKNLRMI